MFYYSNWYKNRQGLNTFLFIVHLNNKLDWSNNWCFLQEWSEQSRLFCEYSCSRLPICCCDTWISPTTIKDISILYFCSIFSKLECCKRLIYSSNSIYYNKRMLLRIISCHLIISADENTTFKNSILHQTSRNTFI